MAICLGGSEEAWFLRKMDLLDFWAAGYLIRESHGQWCSQKTKPSMSRSKARSPPLSHDLHPMYRTPSGATKRGLLAPLAWSGLKQRLSVFADDVVVLFKTNGTETSMSGAILRLFGQASALVVNMSKCVAMSDAHMMRWRLSRHPWAAPLRRFHANTWVCC